MNISSKQIQQILRIFQMQARTEKVAKPQAAGRTMTADKVSLSKESKEMQAIRQRIQGASEVREELVAELRKAVREGRYEVSGEQVAEKMLGRSLADMID